MERLIRQIRSLGTFWVADATPEHLRAIRTRELNAVLGLLPAQGRVLEVGAGTGWQAQMLAEHGYTVEAIDLASSRYRDSRVRPITEYDGRTIPYQDHSFDIVFSSCVLEHIPHVRAFQREIHRVLKPGGCALHVVPSRTWRLWTNVTHVAKCWSFPRPHGAIASGTLTEALSFGNGRWSQLFRETGWVIAAQIPGGLFYTGVSLMDSRLSITRRRQLSRLLGSPCTTFLLQEAPDEA